jgi:CRISPR system Cascade subunit CasE
MYLSLLEIDSHSPIARTWLANPYRVHQRLLMGVPETERGRVLFRIEDEWAPPRILVQAETQAQWDVAFADLLVLASAPRQKAAQVSVAVDDVLRFRLHANPTKRLSAKSPGSKVDGPRVGLFKEEEQRGWLKRKADGAGFELLGVDVRPCSTIVSRKNSAKDSARQSHLAVRFDGRLRVTDADALDQAIRWGIGSAKAYGFGLLSLAR